MAGFVRQQAEKLIEIAKEEHRIKVELLNLDLQLQPAETLQANLDKQWQLLGELRSINMDQKLPILRKLADFISARLKEREEAAAKAEAASAE